MLTLRPWSCAQKAWKRVIEQNDVKAAIPVHIYGIPCEMDKINTVCRKKNVAIIEDSAQASGTITPLGPVGANPFSLVTFSFYPTKNLSAMGDAGAILTHSADLAKKIEIIRNHGRGGMELLEEILVVIISKLLFFTTS